MVNIPGDEDRLTVVGSTGTGKTVAGAFFLAMMKWREKPCYIIDYKHDALIAEIVDAANGKEIPVTSRPQKKPGIYVIRPRPEIDDEAVNQLFYRIWEQENSIVYVDEGYMIPKACPAFVALLTQGRSKKIQMIVLSQRPVLMSRFVFSEATFFAVFRLNDRRDRKTVTELTGIDVNYDLPRFCFVWYDGASNTQTAMRPVPTRSEIINLFRSKQRKAKRL